MKIRVKFVRLTFFLPSPCSSPSERASSETIIGVHNKVAHAHTRQVTTAMGFRKRGASSLGRQKKGMQMIRGKLTRGTPLVGVWRKKRPASAGAKRKRQQTQTAEEADASSYSPGLGSAVGYRHVRMAIAAFYVMVLDGPPKALWKGRDGTIVCIQRSLKVLDAWLAGGHRPPSQRRRCSPTAAGNLPSQLYPAARLAHQQPQPGRLATVPTTACHKVRRLEQRRLHSSNCNTSIPKAPLPPARPGQSYSERCGGGERRGGGRKPWENRVSVFIYCFNIVFVLK